jgi:opacity protein-like surface antigen
MKSMLKASVASTVFLLAVTASPEAFAADLGGSIKDPYVSPMMPMAGGAGPCYMRGDVGYSASQSPTASWPVNNTVWTDNGSGDGVVTADELSSVFVTDAVTNVSLDNTWLAEGGMGCGSGSRGFRAEVMLGYRGDRDLQGEPGLYDPGPAVGDPDPAGPGVPLDDPLHTSIQTYTLMLNVYKDLGTYNRFVPYIGAGIGVAYHDVGEVYFTGNPALTNRIEGDRDIAFAWALMAGVGYQISDRAILDIGYRYIDMGSAQSGRVDSAGNVNPRVEIDDIAAHEVKLGLRYHFGQADCCAGGSFK